MKLQIVGLLLIFTVMRANKTLEQLRNEEQVIAYSYHRNITEGSMSLAECTKQKNKLRKIERKIQTSMSEQSTPRNHSKKGMKHAKSGKQQWLLELMDDEYDFDDDNVSFSTIYFWEK